MSMSMNNYAIILDWDGTLFDSDYLTDSAVEYVFNTRQVSTLSEFRHLLYVPRHGKSLLEQIRIPNANSQRIIEEIAAQIKLRERNADLFSGAREFILGMNKVNIPLSIFTGRTRPSLEAQLCRLNIKNSFQTLICRSDALPKPNPEGLYKLKEYYKEKKLIFIGNSMLDYKCALTAGVDFIGVHLCQRAKRPEIQSPGTHLALNFNALQDFLSERYNIEFPNCI